MIGFFQKRWEINKIRNEIDEIKKWKENETKKYIYDFQQYVTIKSFGESIYTRIAKIVETKEDQINLLKNIVEFNNKSEPRTKEGKDKKGDTYVSGYALSEGWELTLNTFKNGMFPIKAARGEGLKILTSKQMLQWLPISLVRVKAGSTSENLLNETCQIIRNRKRNYWKKYTTK